MAGFLITFEGIDFSGKSLQAKLLTEKLAELQLPVFFVREPGGAEIPEKIRDLLLDTRHHGMTAETEVLLYSAARAQIVRECLIPNLEKGKIVICDRYFDSTTAYQGYGREIDLDFIQKLHTFVIQNVVPDVTFLIDLEPQVALERKKVSNTEMDRLEKEDLSFHHKVRDGYLKLARAEAQRFKVIDGARPIDEVHHEIYQFVKVTLNNRELNGYPNFEIKSNEQGYVA
ncbi:MAG TPA: dTMP kinase [bacterium]